MRNCQSKIGKQRHTLRHGLTEKEEIEGAETCLGTSE